MSHISDMKKQCVFNINKCAVCQSIKQENLLTATSVGKTTLLTAAEQRQDTVHRTVKNIDFEKLPLH